MGRHNYDINSLQTPGRQKRYDCNEVSRSDSSTSKSTGASSFCIDLNVDFEIEKQVNDFDDNSDSTERPIGRNKEKMKKKQGEEMLQYFKSIKKDNEQIMGKFTETRSILPKSYELQLLRAQNEAKN